MLFQRLYNWIKYKTYSQTTLAKNRLFVERDTKRRRIFTNFGLTFRNSKWGNYSLSNIKLEFRPLFLKFLYWLTVFFAVIYFIFNYKTNYICQCVYNQVWSTVWMCQDSLDYCILFALWVVIASLSSLINFVYQLLFYIHFTDKDAVRKVFSSDLVQWIHSYAQASGKIVTKYELTQTITNWLTNNNNKAVEGLVASSFSHKIDLSWWNKNYNLFSRMTRSMLTLNLANQMQNKYLVNDTLKLSNKLLAECGHCSTYLHNANVKVFNDCFQLFSFVNLDKENNNSQKVLNSTDVAKYFSTVHKFNMLDIVTELNKNSFLVKNKIGFFFFHEFDFQKLNFLTSTYPEFFNLTFYMQNQLLTAKWGRWLYRYSILHRKVLKNSHKLTMAKRLFNAGIFDKKFVKTHLNETLFTNTLALYYPNITKTSSMFSYCTSNVIDFINNEQKHNALSLGYYEYSYFWFLKRFYLFNTLPNNFIKSTFKLKEFSNKNLHNLEVFKNTEDENYRIIYSQLLKSPILNLNPFSFSSHRSLTTLTTDATDVFQKSFLNDKKVYLTFAEFDLFANDALYILSKVTAPFAKNNTIYFFSYFNSYAPLTNMPNSGLNLTAADFKILKLELNANSDKNNFFLKDVSHLTYYTDDNSDR